MIGFDAWLVLRYPPFLGTGGRRGAGVALQL